MAILRSWLVLLEFLELCLSPLGLFVGFACAWPWLANLLFTGVWGSVETVLYVAVLALLLQDFEAFL